MSDIYTALGVINQDDVPQGWHDCRFQFTLLKVRDDLAQQGNVFSWTLFGIFGLGANYELRSIKVYECRDDLGCVECRIQRDLESTSQPADSIVSNRRSMLTRIAPILKMPYVALI